MDYYQLESERLIFRKLTEQDISSWAEFFVNNDRLQFFNFDLSKSKEALAEEWIQIQLKRYQNNQFGHLAAELKSDGTFIGLAGILPREFKGKQEYEVAYSLKPAYWGKGYGTEMAKIMKNFGFKYLETPRLISMISFGNEASINVAKKNGMQLLFDAEFEGELLHIFGIKC
ncbi:GNAT family N-acetyltransferase [Mesonia sp. MT50]|uniref:GNAT family N-acetyltransferase n=1 Tax=Mesonia profundi TaxID=3070998 RepID=A0ABU1A5C2_9FLAO|nr:GNAT family N-acetyltransferase [Mesonia profundi]MDQ7918159.1 GNAT family N-acetyltransferase [Mesonia profundi]